MNGTTFKVTLTQHDADEKTWTCECSSVDDSTVNDFTEHFATFPKKEATLREQLIERFAVVHSGRKLVCDTTLWDGEALEFEFKAKVETTAAPPVPAPTQPAGCRLPFRLWSDMPRSSPAPAPAR